MLRSTALIIAFLSCMVTGHLQTRSYTVKYHSDSTSPSVLLSNLLPDQVGNQSPFIGTAFWTDSVNGLLECRSMLSFDLGLLPVLIKPEQIDRATLILQPYRPADIASSGTGNIKLVVKRVKQPWEDSLTSWMNQPEADKYDVVVKKIPAEKEEKELWVNVTEMVRNMLRYGNNGFLLSLPQEARIQGRMGKWFASAKNEQSSLRPVLMIDFSTSAKSNGFPIKQIATSPLIEVAQNVKYLPNGQPTYGQPVPVEIRTQTQKGAPAN